MPFITPSLTELKEQVLADIESANFLQGGILPQSVFKVLAYGQAALSHDHFGYLDWIALQATPFSATAAEYIEAWGRLRGVFRKDSTFSTATVTLTGTAGTVIPAGTELRRADGLTYRTGIEVILPATVSVTATTAGDEGNIGTGVALTLVSPITGAASNATLTSAATGGADAESLDDYRSRMLAAWANPPQGGSAADYVRWCLEVPGVTRAWCSPSGSGRGTVTLYVMLDESNASAGGYPSGTGGVATGERRWPTKATGDLLRVANHVYPVQPVTTEVHVETPARRTIPVTVASLSNNSSTVRAAIIVALADLYRTKSALGAVVYPSEINAAVARAAGTGATFGLTAPTSAVVLLPGELPVTTLSDLTVG